MSKVFYVESRPKVEWWALNGKGLPRPKFGRVGKGLHRKDYAESDAKYLSETYSLREYRVVMEVEDAVSS